MSPTSMATRLREIHAETWNVPHAASVLWTNKLWHNWQPVWEMPAHYDGKRSEQRLTAVSSFRIWTQQDPAPCWSPCKSQQQSCREEVNRRGFPGCLLWPSIPYELRDLAPSWTSSYYHAFGWRPSCFLHGWLKHPAAHPHRLFVVCEPRVDFSFLFSLCVNAMAAVTRHVGLVLKTKDTTYIPTFCQPTSPDSYLGTYRHSLERRLQDWRIAVGRPKITAMLFLNTASCIRRAWAMQLLWLIQLSILWWRSVHPWSVPPNAKQARNRTSQKVAYPSEAASCFMSSSCVRWWTMRHSLELRCARPLIEAADVMVKLWMYDILQFLGAWQHETLRLCRELPNDPVLRRRLSNVKPTLYRADTSSTHDK
jgi:hypothetical protein